MAFDEDGERKKYALEGGRELPSSIVGEIG